MLSFLARKSHSECGFVGYNLRHPAINNFFSQFEQLYTSDSLFREREFHDSYLFDVVRKRFERSGCKTYDIGEGIGLQAHHVLVNSKLGKYMDHLKGDRKIEGKSFRDDLIVARQESHWSKQNSLPFQ